MLQARNQPAHDYDGTFAVEKFKESAEKYCYCSRGLAPRCKASVQ